ncbi:MAG: hypothetical protein HZA50_13040 [Planctomycetes bacterium]|nr:hypothetical protein [Planctomycetota bacterium]
MRETIRILLAGIAVFLGAAVYAQQSASVAAKDIQTLLAEGEPAFTELQAQAWVLELIPMVEKAAGRRFKARPQVVLSDRKTLAEALQKDLLVSLDWLWSSVPAADRQKKARAAAETMAPMLMGLYSFSDEKLYLMPRNIPPLLKACKVDEKHTEAISRIVIAHELTHALQDQQTGLKRRMAGFTGLDAMQAFSSTIEGHAMLMQDRVADALKLDEPARQFARMLAAGAVKFEDPALEIVSKMSGEQYEQIYLGGRKFMEHFARDGDEKLWAIIENPPAATSMIANPETYSTVATGKIDLADVLGGLEKRFDGKWTVVNQEIGRIALSGVYAEMDAQKRKEAVGLVRQVQAMIAAGEGKNAGKVFSVSIFILNNAPACKTLVNSVEEMARANFEKLKRSEVIKVQDAAFSDLKGVKGDICRMVEFTLTDAKAAQKNGTRIMRICRGDCMIEIFTQDVSMEESRLSDLIEEVFRKLNAAISAPASLPSAPATKRAAEFKPILSE